MLMYSMWTSTEDQAILIDSSLAYLQPPTDLIQEALTILFRTPNLPLAGLVMQQYFGLGSKPITNKTPQFLRLEHATSFIFDFVALRFTYFYDKLQEISAGASSTLNALAALQEKELHAVAESVMDALPFQGMLDHGKDTG